MWNFVGLDLCAWFAVGMATAHYIEQSVDEMHLLEPWQLAAARLAIVAVAPIVIAVGVVRVLFLLVRSHRSIFTKEDE